MSATKERLSFEEFRARRLSFKKQMEIDSPWTKGLGGDFESMTRFIYKIFYIKKNKEFAYTR